MKLQHRELRAFPFPVTLGRGTLTGVCGGWFLEQEGWLIPMGRSPVVTQLFLPWPVLGTPKEKTLVLALWLLIVS